MKRVKNWVTRVPWKRVGLIVAVAAPLLMIAVQLAYPAERTMLSAQVDGVDVGGKERSQAIDQLNETHQNLPFNVYFGEAEEPYRSPKLRELGATVASDEAVDSAMYSWWWRLVPTSLWWAHAVAEPQPSSVALNGEMVRAYTTEELGESCEVAPKNASISAGESRLELVPSEYGGTCEIDDVVELIASAQIAATKTNEVRVPLERIDPEIADADAEALIQTIEERLEAGVKLTFENHSATLEAAAVRSWLTFEAKDKKLIAAVDAEKAKDALAKEFQARVAVTPGVVTITTRDFQEVSRSGGGAGRALSIAGTAGSITKYVTAEADQATVAVTTLQPQERYIRSYSSTDTGLSALIQHYAQDRPGTYGVSLIELSGKQRRAGYNQSRNFFPASTYKVFVAYSVLRQVEAGKMGWNDQVVGGRTLAQCFDDMIVISDNACPETLTLKIGVSTINADIANLGINNTRFVGPGQHRSTAEDLSTFMASLQTGQLSINNASRDRLMSALRRNIFRQGIPAGASGSVANKVGFINGLLHDTAIVNASGGTYVLTIMTDGSSWARIAELTREIEKLRAQ